MAKSVCVELVSAQSNEFEIFFRTNLLWSRFTLTGTITHENWHLSLKKSLVNDHKWHSLLLMLIKSHSNKSLNVKDRGLNISGLNQALAERRDRSYRKVSLSMVRHWKRILNHVSGIKNPPGKLPSWYYMFNGQQFEYLEGSDYKAVVKAVFRLEGLQ